MVNPDVQVNEAEMTVSIESCARCGGTHENLVFRELQNPPPDWRYFATCPVTQQPIWLMKKE